IRFAEGERVRMARVLIVDDSAVARKSLREILTILGHTVVSEAVNGAQAFMEYSLHKPDIVTMDLTMQGLGGAEATSKITTSYPDARIIVISATEERTAILDALERGARHFIVKPITEEKVSSVMKNVLRQKFDIQKQKDLVRKLKAEEGSKEKGLPPYVISQDNKLTMVAINPIISMTSYRSLAMELEEYLNDSPQVLFDFGNMQSLDEDIVAAIEKLIEEIIDIEGTVKAITRSHNFVDFITMEVTAPSLASIIRYFR
ncbi:MAG TPA: response regulator, partial [Ruminiclostridium sp.]|nr:response regulator [Ruminiclostridium sp.]